MQDNVVLKQKQQAQWLSVNIHRDEVKVNIHR